MGCGQCDRGRHGDGNVFIGGNGWRLIQNLWGMDGVKSHLRAVSSDPLFSGFAVDSLKESKKRRRKTKNHAMAQLYPYAYPTHLRLPTYAACGDERLTYMKHAKFQVKSALGSLSP